jgi:hypothetical protein
VAFVIFVASLKKNNIPVPESWSGQKMEYFFQLNLNPISLSDFTIIYWPFHSEKSLLPVKILGLNFTSNFNAVPVPIQYISFELQIFYFNLSVIYLVKSSELFVCVFNLKESYLSLALFLLLKWLSGPPLGPVDLTKEWGGKIRIHKSFTIP